MGGNERRAVFLLATVLAAGLAGCLGDGKRTADDDEAGDGGDVAPEPVFTAQTGAVSGFVADTNFRPIAGATVSIVALERTTRTDALGNYALSDLEPGSHLLVANATGYGAKAKPVVVEAGGAIRETFLLEPTPIVEPYVDQPTPFQGYISCASFIGSNVECTATDPNHKQSGDYIVASGLQAILFEMTWDRTKGVALNDDGIGPFTGGMVMSFVWDTPDGTGRASGRGDSPIRILFTREPTGDGYAIYCREGCDSAFQEGAVGGDVSVGSPISFAGAVAAFNAVFQRPFTVYVTAFYHQPMPEAFSAIPDA